MRPSDRRAIVYGMTKALLIAALSLTAPCVRADTFEQPLNGLLQKAHFERGEGRRDWHDRDRDRREWREREEWREYRERDRERGERLRNMPPHVHEDEPRPSQPRERQDDARGSHGGWGAHHGDWDGTRRRGWRWDGQYPVWWGWVAWTASARAGCASYYDSLETDCEIACGDERVDCVTACGNGDACVAQCRVNDNACNQSCLDQRAQQVGLYCR